MKLNIIKKIHIKIKNGFTLRINRISKMSSNNNPKHIQFITINKIQICSTMINTIFTMEELIRIFKMNKYGFNDKKTKNS
jgi:hypothetical protein